MTALAFKMSKAPGEIIRWGKKRDDSRTDTWYAQAEIELHKYRLRKWLSRRSVKVVFNRPAS